MPAKEINPRLLAWGSDIEPGTIRQAEKTARLPIVEGHVALMPDAHVGIGATVGSVIPTKGAVIPAAVGVDIGCGMIAASLDLREDQLPDDLEPLLARIERVIPAGVGRGHDEIARRAERWMAEHRPATALSSDRVGKALKQFGTLGSGNHFFELCIDERRRVWVVLHSGSRGIGNQLAQAHIAKARKLAASAMLQLEDRDLAYFVQGTREFEAYIDDMHWAQDYALANREAMMERALREVLAFVGTGSVVQSINCFAGETEVMTRTGTATIATLSGGVHELLTTDGVWVKAPVLSFGRQELLKVTLSRSGVLKEIWATPGHRWLHRTRRGKLIEATTEQLQRGDRLAFAFPPSPDGRHIDRESVARGFVYGDGSSTSSRSRANFCGTKDEALLPYFEWLGRPVRRYGSLAVINGLPRSWKVDRPPLDAPPSVLYGWLAGYFAADGDVDKTGRPTLSSARRDDLEYVRLVCTQIGIGTFGVRSRLRQGYGAAPSELHLVGLMRGDLDEDFFVLEHHRDRFLAGRGAAERRGWNVVKVEATGRVDEVFCAVVEGTEAFCLADNILTRNCHHNFTQLEVHDGQELWVTRKGAIKADRGDLGVIPGSMGTRSYIVRGRGNAASWNSCSHGAGRRHSRGEAKRRFTKADLAEAMAGKTWLRGQADKLIDEIPAAYKDVDQVMRDQEDLVETLHVLTQVLNYKGT
jgi:RNA-splicing ligase RtcB